MDREQWLEEKYQKHKGEWLNQKVAEEYRSRAKKIRNETRENIGEIRKLEQELMEKYDILEIEATNIIWGYHISDYVYKYENIRKYGENLERNRAEEEGGIAPS